MKRHRHTAECLIACDKPSDAEVRLEMVEALEGLRKGGPGAPPWMDLDEAIAFLEKELAEFDADRGDN